MLLLSTWDMKTGQVSTYSACKLLAPSSLLSGKLYNRVMVLHHNLYHMNQKTCPLKNVDSRLPCMKHIDLVVNFCNYAVLDYTILWLMVKGIHILVPFAYLSVSYIKFEWAENTAVQVCTKSWATNKFAVQPSGFFESYIIWVIFKLIQPDVITRVCFKLFFHSQTFGDTIFSVIFFLQRACLRQDLHLPSIDCKLHILSAAPPGNEYGMITAVSNFKILKFVSPNFY